MTFEMIVRSWILLLFTIFWLLLWSACQTIPLAGFEKIKTNMTKDEVLDIVGSPNRTERDHGKEKWAYHFFSPDDHDTEILRQVTFLDGHVVSSGEDFDEEKRIKEIHNGPSHHKGSHSNVSSEIQGEVQATPVSSGDKTSDSTTSELEKKKPIESDFVEVKGHREPVSH